MNTKWKPIETAPKDGRPLVVCCRYNGDSTALGVVTWVVYDDGSGYWMENMGGESYSDYAVTNATHWAEIPGFDCSA